MPGHRQMEMKDRIWPCRRLLGPLVQPALQPPSISRFALYRSAKTACPIEPLHPMFMNTDTFITHQVVAYSKDEDTSGFVLFKKESIAANRNRTVSVVTHIASY